MKRLCFGSLLTILYQARLGSKKLETIADAILTAFNPSFTSYDPSLPGHLRSGHSNAPTAVSENIEKTTESQVCLRFQDNVIPLIRSDLHPAIVLAIKGVIEEDADIKSNTILGYTAEFKSANIMSTTKFDLSRLLTNLFYYSILMNNNRKCADSIKEIPKDYVQSFTEATSSRPIQSYDRHFICGTPKDHIWIFKQELHISNEIIILPNDLSEADLQESNNKFEKDVADAILDNKRKNGNQEASTADFTEKDQQYLKDQRRYFFSAERLRRAVRDFDDGEDQIDFIKDQTYEGIKETYEASSYCDGLERLKTVLSKAVELPLSQSVLVNAITIENRKGFCHMLANDGTIESWVKEDEK